MTTFVLPIDPTSADPINLADLAPVTEGVPVCTQGLTKTAVVDPKITTFLQDNFQLIALALLALIFLRK